jgi:hypothetical protein
MLHKIIKVNSRYFNQQKETNKCKIKNIWFIIIIIFFNNITILIINIVNIVYFLLFKIKHGPFILV